VLVGCVLAAASACDTPATASDPQGLTPRAELKSREYESCAGSVQCADGLRCFDNVCLRARRSVLGDYAAARGDLLHAAGDDTAAIGAYAEAVSRYSGEGLAVVADIECRYGAALISLRSDKEKAELAARVLHRCLLAAPAGSDLYRTAMHHLATLHDSGLDPAHLAKTQPADLYLTRAPARPDASNVKISATASPTPTGKSFATVTARLAEPDLRAPLIACWDKHYAATRKPVLAVPLAIKTKIIPSEYDDEPDRLTVVLDPAPPPGEAAACVRAAVEPALTGLKTVRETFTTTLTIRIE